MYQKYRQFIRSLNLDTNPVLLTLAARPTPATCASAASRAATCSPVTCASTPGLSRTPAGCVGRSSAGTVETVLYCRESEGREWLWLCFHITSGIMCFSLRSDHLSTHQRTHTGEKPYRYDKNSTCTVKPIKIQLKQ